MRQETLSIRRKEGQRPPPLLLFAAQAPRGFARIRYVRPPPPPITAG
ncbi:MAG: hypothetical protein LBQ52_03660 [Helicobacteraceae bacterium]|nr:hypothetical protein [Helicobacteraceae bacterium]